MEIKELKEYKNPTEETKETKLDVEELKTSKGLPGFWAKAMKNNSIISTYLRDPDLPILNFVTDIYSERMKGNSFKIIFKFAPNEYFIDEVLTKTIIIDKNDNQICKETIGSQIHWRDGKNVTVKLVKKKKNKSNY